MGLSDQQEGAPLHRKLTQYWKKNSELLSKLIAKYSGGAQYIVISHNDSVISEADTLFGISMKEGISKVTSLRI